MVAMGWHSDTVTRFRLPSLPLTCQSILAIAMSCYCKVYGEPATLPSNHGNRKMILDFDRLRRIRLLEERGWHGVEVALEREGIVLSDSNDPRADEALAECSAFFDGLIDQRCPDCRQYTVEARCGLRTCRACGAYIGLADDWWEYNQGWWDYIDHGDIGPVDYRTKFGDPPMKMPFGKYKGRELGNVPLDYLIWLVEQKGPLRDSDLADAVLQRFRRCRKMMDRGEQLRWPVDRNGLEKALELLAPRVHPQKEVLQD